MAKSKIDKPSFECSSCGAEFTKWVGKCPQCKEWNSLEEVTKIKKMLTPVAEKHTNLIEGHSARKVNEIVAEAVERISTGISEFDRVLGGGIVIGSLILITGTPGAGKSTLLSALGSTIRTEDNILYASGEESEYQIKMRMSRLNAERDNVYLVTESSIHKVEEEAQRVGAKLLIIDSIQTMIDPTVNATAGSISQIKACTTRLMDLSKKLGLTIILVGHVTKDGDLAGPRHLEHMVDAVFMIDGDRQQQLRVLRSEKNRFGSTEEVGLFEMTGTGLKEVTNPSEIFVNSIGEVQSGSATVVTMEGTRPIPVEVQALIIPTTFNYPRRMAVGIDNNRLLMLAAVIEKKTGICLSKYDIYINVVGGFKINETAADLAVAFAIISSVKDTPIDRKTAIIGEIGLSGEIRPVPRLQQRIQEAKRLGWEAVYVPQQVREQVVDIETKVVVSIQQAILSQFGGERR